MRAYFNLIDWEKKSCEDQINTEFSKEKANFSQQRRVFQKFTREDLFKIAESLKQKLNQDDDYAVPEEILNYKKQQRRTLELVNEFSRDSVDFLKNKPKNFLLVTGLENEDYDVVVQLLKTKGEVASHQPVKDLMGRLCAAEVFFYTDADALKAKIHLHNYKFKPGATLRIFSPQDAKKEEEKTVVVSGLKKDMKRLDLLYAVADMGHVVKLEMPIERNIPNTTKPSKTSFDLAKTTEHYFAQMEKSLNNKTLIEQANMKKKLSFYLTQIKSLVKTFRRKLENNNEENETTRRDKMNNLLVEIKFFMKKFFPNEIVNDLLLKEIDKNNVTNPNTNSSNLNLGEINSKEKSNVLFEKVIANVESFLKKYEEKMEILSKPINPDEMIIDTADDTVKNKFDPEKLPNELIFSEAGAEYQNDSNSVNSAFSPEIKSEFSKMNFYSTFSPLQAQINKQNFLRSLSEEEKLLIKDKFDISLSVNTPKFLDYFINFSRAIGVQILDKYIELSNLYMAMTPLEKKFHGRKLVTEFSNENKVFDSDTKMYTEGLYDYLGIRKLRRIKDVYHLREMASEFEDNHYTRDLDIEEDFVLVDFANMIASGKMPNITFNEFAEVMNGTKMEQKMSYMQTLLPMNLAKKRVFIERIRARMVKYNEIFLEFVKNYELLPPSDSLREKYDSEVDKLKTLIFGKFDSLENVDMNLLLDEADEVIGFDLDEKHRMDYEQEIEEEDDEGNKIVKEKKEAAASMDKEKSSKNKDTNKATPVDKEQDNAKKLKKFNRNEYRYSGKPLLENQIINRLDYIKSIRDKVINSILRISNLKHYTSKKYDRINTIIQERLVEKVNTLFGDNPKLQAFYLEKIQSQAEKFKYNTLGFEERQYKFEEIVEDIIQKEVDYAKKTEFARKYIENMEEVIGEKISKSNLVKAMSVYDALFKIHEKYVDYNYLKSVKRSHTGSPIFVFFAHVKGVFEKEMKSVKKVKESILKEGETRLSLDELYSKRKYLIDDYTTKIAEYNLFLDQTKEELETYKLEKLKNMTSDLKTLLMDKDDKEKSIYNAYLDELKKKEYEIEKNKQKWGLQYEEEYKDVTSLISNLNKLNKKNPHELMTMEKISNTLKNTKEHNKGYAFVTFLSSDEAKMFYLNALNGLRLNKSKVQVFPKFDTSHETMDEDFMLKRAKLDQNILNKRESMIQSEEDLNAFEENIYDALDKNAKLKEYENVRAAFKELYTDPFQKHDENNPMTQEEEEEMHWRIKKAKEANQNEIDNAWLMEDKNLEKLRRARDKRIVKTYTEAQLLKKGVDVANLNKKNTSINVDYVNLLAESLFTKTADFEPSNTVHSTSRNFSPVGTKEYIEALIDPDYLNHKSAAFEKDYREEKVYNEIKELRDRFPKEKFSTDPKESENLINEVNAKFIRLLKYEDKEKTNEIAQDELLEKITNLTPIGKQVQMIINERNEKVQEEETRQLLTMQHFYEKRIERHYFKENMIQDIPEEAIDSIAMNTFTSFNQPGTEYERIEYAYPSLVEQGERKKIADEDEDDDNVREDKKFQAGDTSFEAFLHRRKDYIEEAEEETNEKDKTQFDPNNVNVLQSIKEKYETHLGKDAKASPYTIQNSRSKNSVYNFLENKNKNTKKRDFNAGNLGKKIKEENMKNLFIKNLENTFNEELSTLPDFRKYFDNLKNETPSNASNATDDKNPSNAFNYSSRFKIDRKREEWALLQSAKIDPKTFEKTFVANQKAREDQMKAWISSQDEKDFIEMLFHSNGIDTHDLEEMELLKANSPELFDESKADLALREMTREDDEEEESLETKGEDEYYFNPEAGETLEEHLAALSKTNFTAVYVSKTDDGRIAIRREYKNNFKYDLDEVMNFDPVQERERVLSNYTNANFKKKIAGDVDFFSAFVGLIQSDAKVFNAYISDDFERIIAKAVGKVEDCFRVNFDMESFVFADLKCLLDNLFSLNANTLNSILQSIGRLINLFAGVNVNKEDVTETLNNISNFSKDVFHEREVRLLVELMKGVHRDLKGRHVNINDNFSKFLFVQNVLMKEFLKSLEGNLTKEESIFILGILKILPNNVSLKEDMTIKRSLKVLLWEEYKSKVLKDLNNIKLKRGRLNMDLVNAEERKMILSVLNKQVQFSDVDYGKVDKEIEEFNVKLKEYYNDILKTGKL